MKKEKISTGRTPLQDEKQDVLSLLDEEEQEVRYLDIGEINGVWYYGFNLKGKDTIITSEGKILRNTEETFKERKIGENEIKQLFEYQGYVGDIAPQIAKETIKKFYTKSARNHLIKPKEIYKEIREKILHYMDFGEKEEIADVLTCWVICTYCYPLFFWFPHILFNAPSTSGKSKCAFLITQLSFRGFDLGASAGVTPAQIFRTLEGNRGTILIDEFETDGNDPTQTLVNQILNASAARDAYVIRVEQINKKWRAWRFPIYCPKIACNISGINPTSLTRFIAFKWLKTKSEKGRKKPQKEKDKASFKPLRENLYLFMLENWEQIKKNYEGLELDFLNNRDEDNWMPLFAIAKFIDSCEGEKLNIYEQLKKYIENYEELGIETNDQTADFFYILKNVVETASYYTPSELADAEGVPELLKHLKSPANWIGKKLTLYKFFSTRGGGQKRYLLDPVQIKNLIDLYFLEEKKEAQK